MRPHASCTMSNSPSFHWQIRGVIRNLVWKAITPLDLKWHGNYTRYNVRIQSASATKELRASFKWHVLNYAAPSRDLASKNLYPASPSAYRRMLPTSKKCLRYVLKHHSILLCVEKHILNLQKFGKLNTYFLDLLRKRSFLTAETISFFDLRLSN